MRCNLTVTIIAAVAAAALIATPRAEAQSPLQQGWHFMQYAQYGVCVRYGKAMQALGAAKARMAEEQARLAELPAGSPEATASRAALAEAQAAASQAEAEAAAARKSYADTLFVLKSYRLASVCTI